MTTNLASLISDLRGFMRTEVFPLEERFLNEPLSEVQPALDALREEVKANSWWAPHLPAEWNGMGLSLPDFARVGEELGQSIIGHYLFNCQAPDCGNMEILMEYGTAAQKETFLRPLSAGDIRSCFSMTEPEHAGSNPVWMSTTAVKDGDEYVINGHKWFTSAADGASFAIVMAVTDPDAAPHERASQIIVPLDTPGFTRVRNTSVMGHSGGGYFSHAEVRYENCRVPQTNILGAEGRGFALAQQRLGPGRIHHCMRWIGICERAFDLMCRRAATRELSPGKMLGEKQAIQHWIAESRASIDAARLLVLRTAERIEAEGQTAVREDISLIKFFVANV
ncbi:MAG: acyl-CoA dehydrogenase family protein, partial [Pyrinomonadaceae bacterium]